MQVLRVIDNTTTGAAGGALPALTGSCECGVPHAIALLAPLALRRWQSLPAPTHADEDAGLPPLRQRCHGVEAAMAIHGKLARPGETAAGMLQSGRVLVAQLRERQGITGPSQL